jgi:hypothetical protein
MVEVCFLPSTALMLGRPYYIIRLYLVYNNFDVVKPSLLGYRFYFSH